MFAVIKMYISITPSLARVLPTKVLQDRLTLVLLYQFPKFILFCGKMFLFCFLSQFPFKSCIYPFSSYISADVGLQHLTKKNALPLFLKPTRLACFTFHTVSTQNILITMQPHKTYDPLFPTLIKIRFTAKFHCGDIFIVKTAMVRHSCDQYKSYSQNILCNLSIVETQII